MKFVLVVIWLAVNGPVNNRHVTMQEFDSKQTCETAAQYLYQHGRVHAATCLQK